MIWTNKHILWVLLKSAHSPELPQVSADPKSKLQELLRYNFVYREDAAPTDLLQHQSIGRSNVHYEHLHEN